jgi:hypothetical protein
MALQYRRIPGPDRVSAPESLEAACEAALEAKRDNGLLYEQLMDAAGGRADVEETARRLLTASEENRTAAFERARERSGGGRRERHGQVGGTDIGTGAEGLRTRGRRSGERPPPSGGKRKRHANG